MATAFEDFTNGVALKLERGSRAHGLGWGYEGVIRRRMPRQFGSGTIEAEEVLSVCGHVHATKDDARDCDSLPDRLS